MRNNNPQQHPEALLLIARLLILAAAGIAGYLAWLSWGGSAIVGCGPDSNCHRVLSTRWAYWLGLPVSFLALLVYLVLFGTTFFTGPRVAIERRYSAWSLIVTLCLLAVGAAIWFVGLQFIVIKSVCPFCMTAHVCGATASVILLLIARNLHRSLPRMPRKKPAPPPLFSGSRVRRIWLVSAAGLALLIAGQVLYERPTYMVQSLGATNRPAATGSVARLFSIHDGKFQLNLRETPLIGSPEAPHVVVSLFDYTCHHCRLMHGHLKQVYQSFSNQLAIVSLPMPLDSDCNPLVKLTPAPHVNACQYARIGLAVWRAKREVSEEFDDWLFAPERPLSVDEVRQHAEKLVGKERFERAFGDEWITRQIQQDVDIFRANTQVTHKGAMPQLIVGGAIAVGEMARADDLYRLLEAQMGLKR
jgi:uncharacterized membrane protein